MVKSTSKVEAQFEEARAAWGIFRRKNPTATLIQFHRDMDGLVYIIAHHPASLDPQLTIDARALAEHYRTDGLLEAA